VAQSILEDLPEQAFTESTIKRMYGLVDRAKTDPDFQKLIYGIVNRAMPGEWKNYRGELAKVFNWFKKNVDYRRDPYGVELLQDVWSTLDRKRGDCDDATTFLASAAEVLGSPARIVTVSTRKSKEPNHVYAEAYVGGRWLGLDATVPGSTVGWTPQRVTARQIWTRKSLGLPGGDDLDGIEGLGMSDDIYSQGDWRGTMMPVSGRLAPGVPDDISHTDAGAMPGTSVQSRRKIWRAPVANVSDETSNPRPGGGVYGQALPIKSMPTPSELWYLVDRKYVPKVLDPDSAWWGKVPTSKEDLNRMFPGSEGTMATYLKDIASVPASAIAQIEQGVRKQLETGQIGVGEIGEAIQEGLEGYALGLPPGARHRKWQGVRRAAQRPPLPGRQMPRPLPDRRYLVPAPVSRIPYTHGGSLNGLGELGDALTDAVSAISSGVKTGTVPSDAGSISKAIDSVVGMITGKPVTADATGGVPAASTVAKSAIPIGMLALLGGAAWLMTSGSSKGKYRRNPSRRRSSRGRGRKGGGFDVKTALLWGGGGLAAYYLFLRPGATLLPASLTAPKPATATGVNATQQAIAAGVKAAPSIFDSITKLFGGSSSPTPAAQPSTGFEWNTLGPTQSAPAAQPSGFEFNSIA
jgi:hypothetical protein